MSVENQVSEKSNLKTEKPIIKAYGKRWIILIIYILYATLSTAQWVEYSIITDVVMKYYKVSSSAVDLTSMSFMIMWPILVFPSSFIIDKMGLKVAGLLGSFASALGAAIKLLSIGQDSFYVILIGQIVVAVSQTLILSLPPKIAVTWFKPEEISTVCSLGIFGMTLGSALGFVVPPMMVHDSENLEDIAFDLKIMCWTLFLTTTPLALSVVFYFPKEPPHPPSQTMLEERENRENVTFLVFIRSIKTLISNKALLLHTVCYGCNVGIYSAIGTLLNQYILNYFPGAQEDAGRMGLVMIVSGMIGSVLIGVILDKTHKFKESAFMLFLLSAISMVGFIYSLEFRSKWMVYVAIAIFGLFLNSYLPVGVEFATEISFPSPESTVAGILMATSQVLGVIITMVGGIINRSYGTYWSIMTMAAVLAIGTILTFLTPNKLNRQAAFKKGRDVEFSVIPQKV